MNAAPESLEGLRRDIDNIDDELHDLLVRRAEVVRRIGAVKGPGAAAYRPGREARLLRRLVQRPSGPLSKSVVVQLWRELLGATTRLQGDFRVAVFDADGGLACRALARDHYGRETPLTAFTSAVQVLNAVRKGDASAGVLPLPQEDDIDPWWPWLVTLGRGGPRAVARLPFAEPESRSGGGQALVLAMQDGEASGLDRSLFLLETGEQLSRARLDEAIAAADLNIRLHLSWDERDGRKGRLHLVDFEGFFNEADPRIADIGKHLGTPLANTVYVGGYAVPMTRAELD